MVSDIRYFQLTTPAIMVSLLDASHMGILSQNAITGTKLKQLTKDMLVCHNLIVILRVNKNLALVRAIHLDR